MGIFNFFHSHSAWLCTHSQPILFFPGIPEVGSSRSTLRHKAIEWGWLPNTPIPLVAVSDCPSGQPPICFVDLGFEGSRPAQGFRGGVPSEPRFPWASHSSGHHDGCVQGRAERCMETLAGNTGTGSFPLAWILRR